MKPENSMDGTTCSSGKCSWCIAVTYPGTFRVALKLCMSNSSCPVVPVLLGLAVHLQPHQQLWMYACLSACVCAGGGQDHCPPRRGDQAGGSNARPLTVRPSRQLQRGEETQPAAAQCRGDSSAASCDFNPSNRSSSSSRAGAAWLGGSLRLQLLHTGQHSLAVQGCQYSLAVQG
jgi:hypothetical protein